METTRPQARLETSLAEIARLLEKHRLLETLAQRGDGPRRDLVEGLQHRQNLAELHKRLRTMHVGDVAYVLAALPLDDRRTIWEQLGREQAGEVFVEVSDAVRESLVDMTPRDTLIALVTPLDPEDLAYVSEALPEDVVEEVTRALALTDRSVFEESIQYDETAVGHYMTREWVAVPETHTLEQVLAHIRTLTELPPQTDRIFVVDARNILRGTVPLRALLVTDAATPIATIVRDADTISFEPRDEAAEAVKAFERYDLVSAPVVDSRGKVVGRLTVDAAMDVLRDAASLQALRSAGLSEDEDLFGAPWRSARNRWPWLAINLITAFIASRVIGRFEGAIRELAGLAALMPIVASIGGNTGNQTMALVIRALALDQIQASGARQLLKKELGISLLNGTVWGVIVGIFAVAFYSHLALGLVMSGAVILNLVVAAVAAVAIPLTLHAAGRDPAHGSSVLLTFVTDAMGFFLFLGLATLFLL